MKTLEKFDFGSRSGAFRSTYDWASILDGKIHELEAGKDFNCKPITIKSRARAVAKKMGLGVRLGTNAAGNVIIQSCALPPEDEFTKAAKAARLAKAKATRDANKAKAAAESPEENEEVEADAEDEDEAGEGEVEADAAEAPKAHVRRRRK